MRKHVLILLLLLLPFLLFASIEEAEGILIKAFCNSIIDYSFITLDNTLVYLGGFKMINLDDYDKDKEYEPDFIDLYYLKTKDEYIRIKFPIYVRANDEKEERIYLNFENEKYYYDRDKDKVYSYSYMRSDLVERDEDGSIHLRDICIITGIEDVIYEEVPCYLIEIKNTLAKCTIKLWIEKERNVFLRWDTILTGNILYQRNLYLEYIKLGNYYIEKKYTMWKQESGEYINIYTIMDPQFIDIDDKFFDSEILRYL